jgi:ribose transport system permease protein
LTEAALPAVAAPEPIPEQVARSASVGAALRRVSHTLGLAVAVVVFGVVFTALNANFGHLANLGNIAAQSSILGIMATGMTFAIVAGEIDLSVGSVFALASMVFGLLLQGGTNLYVSALLAVVVGAALGVTTGALSVAFNVPTIIITLGTLNVYAGIALWSNNGLPVSDFSTSGWLFHFSQVNFGGPHFISWLPEISVAWILSCLVGYLLLTKTAFGLRIFATGSSRQAARYAGISFNRVRIAALALVGASAGIAGVLSVGQYGSASPGAGSTYNLTVIAAVIIGGAALNGGRGSVVASAFGVLLLGEVNNGLIVAGVNLYGQIVAQGALVVLAVAIDQVVHGNTWYVAAVQRVVRGRREQLHPPYK